MGEGRLTRIRWVSVFLLDEEGRGEFKRKVGSEWIQKIKRRERRGKSEVCMNVPPTFGFRKTQKVTIPVRILGTVCIA